MLTLAQAKTENAIISVAGVSTDSPQFIAYLNQACRSLVTQGEWWGTVKAMNGVAYRGCLVWPLGVEAVLAMNTGRHQARIANYWYEFVPMDGRMHNVSHHHQHHHNIVRFSGTVPVFLSPTVDNPFNVQVSLDNTADYGSVITIYGTDTNGKEVVSTRPDGSIQRGYILTPVLGNPTPVTTVVFSSITAVTKPTTVGGVNLYVNTPLSQFSQPIAHYRASDTNPQFLFSNLAGCNHIQQICIEALVKMSFQPVAVDADFLSIENVDAIGSMIQSIRSREAGNEDNAIKQELYAIAKLNAELRNRFPDNQAVIRVEPMLGRRIKNPV